MLTNTTLHRLGFVNSYILIAFVDSCRDNKLSSSGRILFWIGGKVIRRQDREILESVAKNLLRINEHAIANVFLYLYFQLRIMYVKNIYLSLVLTTKFAGYSHATYQQIVVYTGDLGIIKSLSISNFVSFLVWPLPRLFYFLAKAVDISFLTSSTMVWCGPS